MLLQLFVAGYIAFHAASLQSMLADGPAFSSWDPVLTMVAVVVLAATVVLTASRPRVHLVVCTLGAWALAAKGVVAEVTARTEYVSAEGLHPRYWAYGMGLCGVGTAALVGRLLQTKHGGRGLRVLVVLLAWSVASPRAPSAPRCHDAPWWSAADAWDGTLPGARHLPFERTSQYLEMSDGVKLAIDLYLPRGSAAAVQTERRSTFLHFTRYRRAEQRSWITRWLVLFDQPPSPTFTMRSLRYVEHFVPDGYAYVTVDTRGAGASFGTKPNDLLPREFADVNEVSDWVVRQDWCNGRIGTGGISYDGIMGAEAAAQGNIAAVALLHSYADIYDDLVLPGGVPNMGFLSLYGAFTSASEQNVPAVHPDLTWGFVLADLLFAGTAGVDPNNPTQLDAAVAEHSDNYNMAAKITDPAFLCKDSVVVTANGSNYTWTDLSNTEVTANALVSHRVSVAAWAGYQDSGSVRSAARMHNALVAAGAPSRLTIGPWVHGGRTCWTPAGGAERGEPSFSLDLAVKRFFDCELRDQCDVFGSAGGAQDPPLHFFMSGTAGPDEWRAAPDQWPPAGLVWHDLYMHTVDKSLRPHAVEDARLSADFRVNFRATTGKASRWNLVLHLLKVLVTYPTRGEDAARMLSRSTAPLESDINIVGSAHVDVVVELVAPLTATEAVVFVYLEDVDPDGAVTYITEGQVRAAHPVVNTADDARVGSFDAFSRSFTCFDMQPLTAGVPAAISILLEPIAYRVPIGHRVRLSIAGADADNFHLDAINQTGTLATQWRIYDQGTRLRLPTVQSKPEG